MPGLIGQFTKLEYEKNSGVWEEVGNVRSYPSMMGKPTMVPTSVVNAKNGTSAPGQTEPQELEFLCAYGNEGTGGAQAVGTNYGKMKAISATATKYRVRYPDDSGYELTAKNWVGPPNAFQGANNALEFPLILYPQGDITDVAQIPAIGG